MTLIYSRTKGGTFTVYGGSTTHLFMEDYFDDVDATIARLEAGEVITDDHETTWFIPLPVEGETKHKRIVNALRKYGRLKEVPLSQAARCGKHTLRRLAGESVAWSIVNWQRGSPMSGARSPVYGLRDFEPCEESS